MVRNVEERRIPASIAVATCGIVDQQTTRFLCRGDRRERQQRHDNCGPCLHV
jgi:hypothetical protein